MATFTVTNTTGMTIADLVVQHQSVGFFGLQGTVTDVTFDLDGLSHGAIEDLDMLLVGPDGASNLEFFSHVGSGTITGVDYTISDAAGATLPFLGAPATGAYRPTDYDDGTPEIDTDFGLPPLSLTVNHAAPEGGATFSSGFDGIVANGAWEFHLADSSSGNTGSLTGWSVTVTTSSDAVVIDGAATDDTLVVSATGDHGTYSLNGGPAIAFSGVTSFTFNGLAGNDKLIINHIGGDGLFAPSGGIFYNGGAETAGGGDALEINASFAATFATYTFANAHDGTIALTAINNSNLTFTGLEPITSTVATTFTTFNLPATADVAFLEDDDSPLNGRSQLRSDNGTFETVVFAHPINELIINSGAGDTVNVDLADSLGAADLAIGNLTNEAVRPVSINVQNVQADIVTLAATGAVSELGADVAADITATKLGILAGTGIGAGNRLETSVSDLEAVTTTGGIAIANQQGLTIGGITADLSGLFVTTSGDIDISAAGTITLTDNIGSATVTGGSSSGNVTLIANGFDADVTSTVNTDAIRAPSGHIAIKAGRDVSFGATVGNDVVADRSITVNAGRDVLLDGLSDMLSDVFGNDTGGGIAVAAGRNISVLQGGGDTAGFQALGDGTVELTTGALGTLTLLSLSDAFEAAVRSNSGSVYVIADRIIIDGDSGIVAENGEVWLQPRTEGRAIILAGATDTANAVELSDAELDRIFTDALIIGNEFTTGPISVPADVSPANAPDLNLRTGSSITVTAALGATSDLQLEAGNNISVNPSGALNATDGLTLRVDSPDTDTGLGGNLTIQGAANRGASIRGNTDADTLRGTIHDDIFGFSSGSSKGGGGADKMFGGNGNDTFMIRSPEDHPATEQIDGGAGTFDTIRFTSGAESGTLVLSNLVTNVEFADIADTSGSFAGTNALNLNAAAVATGMFLTGNAGPNTLTGTAQGDTLKGGGGSDTLIGGAGVDAFEGGAGDDQYYVDNAAETVTETAGNGAADRVFASVSYTLAAGQQVEKLTTTNSAATTPINLTGNEIPNTIFGNAGANTLDGKGGADVLIGLGGDDFYYVDSASDTVTEGATEGTGDRVLASVSYTLGAAARVEKLTTDNNAGTGAIDLTGNGFVNTIFGNAGANSLDGKGGADSLAGFGGDDFYYVDNAADAITEGGGEGTGDRVLASVDYTLGAGDQVEKLTTTSNVGTGNLNLTGNEFANTIFGNAGSNALKGGLGNDTLVGLGGSDAFVFNTALNGTTNVDAISDFAAADDIILSSGIFTQIAVGTLSAAAFVIGTAATTSAHRIVYNAGAVLYDADGSGGVPAVQFAMLSGAPALTNADFVVL